MRFCQMHVRNLPFNPVIPNVRFCPPENIRKAFLARGIKREHWEEKG